MGLDRSFTDQCKGTIGAGDNAKKQILWLQKNGDRISAELQGIIGEVAAKSSPKPITDLSESDLNRLWDQSTVQFERAEKKTKKQPSTRPS